jgi:hypothetical protein
MRRQRRPIQKQRQLIIEVLPRFVEGNGPFNVRAS